MINTRLANVDLQAGKHTHCSSIADAPKNSSSTVQTGSEQVRLHQNGNGNIRAGTDAIERKRLHQNGTAAPERSTERERLHQNENGFTRTERPGRRTMADNNYQYDSEVDVNVNVNGRGEGQAYQTGTLDEAYGGFYRRGPRPNFKPDPYSGDEDWDQYIAYFEDCTELAQSNEKEKFLYLATSLKQQARMHYSSLPFAEKRSYKLLTNRLEQRVLVKERVKIPHRSFQMSPVEVKCNVPEVVFVDGIQGLQDISCRVVAGIVETQGEDVSVCVVNDFDENNGDILHQLVTPAERRDVVLKLHHDVISGGHLGVEKTMYKIRKALYWPGLADNVKDCC
ncbi:hypothetical protein DPMN_058437 [Dreissena polymorpha]|uniref:Integrase zinc-binding domain-containing protein n=1 Tax=Dreissena polymorpha TaxID=45954 RepID=A0A9D4C212_DREPO|nr:hypothetical protein DPMN_058437 [Dreissena polymorpha]